MMREVSVGGVSGIRTAVGVVPWWELDDGRWTMSSNARGAMGSEAKGMRGDAATDDAWNEMEGNVHHAATRQGGRLQCDV